MAKQATFSKAEVIRNFCALSTKVMKEVYNYREAADCFCSDNNTPDEHFVFSDSVMEFIDDAVNERIEREKDRAYYDYLNI